jgi:hypothetical protein
MAAIVVTRTENNFIALGKDSPARISQAVWPTGGNTGDDGRKCQQGLLGQPDFIVYGTTDTNTADSDAINLSDNGVTFPANTIREITVVAYAGDGTAVRKITAAALVIGGSTPAFAGEAQDVPSVGAVTSDSVTTASYGAAPVITIDFEVVSDEVIIEAVGESSDVVTWVLEVYVGRLIPMTLV